VPGKGRAGTLRISVRLMYVVRLQPVDQCCVHKTDTLALAIGQADDHRAPSPIQRSEIRVIDQVCFTAHRVNREALKRLCMQKLPECIGVHARSIAACIAACKRATPTRERGGGWGGGSFVKQKFTERGADPMVRTEKRPVIRRSMNCSSRWNLQRRDQ